MKNRNIIFHVTKQYMKLNRRRTAITFIGIVFMVILMTCVFAGKRTVLAYLNKVAALDKGNWFVAAYDLTTEETEKIRDMEETTVMGCSEQLGVLEFPQTGNDEEKPYLDVKAYSSESFEMVNIELTEGRFPENKNEIILSDSVIEDGSGIKIGDTISGDFFTRTITVTEEGHTIGFPFFGIELKYNETADVPANFPAVGENNPFREDHIPNGLAAEYTVVGIMKRPVFEDVSGACYPALTVMENNLPLSDTLNVLLRFDPEKVDYERQYVEKIEEIAGRDIETESNNLLLTFSLMSGDETMGDLIMFVTVFFTVFIMAASVILIYNVFNMSFAERTRYLGMLASVGATGKQKRQSIYYECFSLLIPAVPVGILAGTGVVKGGMELLKPWICDIIDLVKPGSAQKLPVTIDAGAGEIALIIIMCVITVMISALIPAVKISKTGPVECIKSGTEKTKNKRFKTKKSLLEKGRPELLLAVNSTGRSKHLTKGIIRSVTVFAVLTVTTLYAAQCVIKIVDIKTQDSGWLPDTTGYDYLVITENDTFDQVMDLVESSDATDNITPEELNPIVGLGVIRDKISDEYFEAYKYIMSQFPEYNEDDWKRMEENGLNDIIGVETIVVSDDDFRAIAAAGDSDMSIVSSPEIPSVLLFNKMHFTTDHTFILGSSANYKFTEVKALYNASKGETIDLIDDYSPDKTSVQVKVAGIIDEKSIKGRIILTADEPYIIINRSAQELIAENLNSVRMDYNTKSILFNYDEKNDPNLIKKLGDLSEETNVSVVKCVGGEVYGNLKRAIAGIVKTLAYCFTALVSVVCLLNLYNSVRGRAAERTRETAMLRSVGMTEKQLAKMHDLENVFLIGKGLLIAAAVSAVLILFFQYALMNLFGNASFTVPYLLCAGITVFIYMATAVFTRICSRNGGNAELIEKIRRERI